MQFRDGDRAHYKLREIAPRVTGRLEGQHATAIQEQLLYSTNMGLVLSLPPPDYPSTHYPRCGQLLSVPSRPKYVLGAEMLEFVPSGVGMAHCPYAHRVVAAHSWAPPHYWYLVPLTIAQAHYGYRRGVWAHLAPATYAATWIQLTYACTYV